MREDTSASQPSFSRYLRLPALIGAAVARQRSAISLIAAVALAFASFRLMVTVGLPQDPNEVLTLVSGLQALIVDFLHFFVVGLLMLLVIEPVRLMGPSAGGRRGVALVAAVSTAALLAAIARLCWFDFVEHAKVDWSTWYIFFIRFGLLAALVVTAGEFHRRELLSLQAMRAAEAERAVLEQQALQAQLKTLEAHVEPHFLFNTLATVRRLYETDAATGKAMLARLTHYLEMALPSIRGERSTLGREADLITAYLDLQRVRMGRRLDYHVDISAHLQNAEVPPLMMLTLVENAIKHGLAPQRQGGRIDVEARAQGRELFLTVTDTGGGFGGGTSGGGAGLANIRARLQAMFGSAGELTLEPKSPHGMRAAIRVPLTQPST